MDSELEKRLKVISVTARRLVFDGVFEAGSGHIGGSLSIIETLVYLYFVYMNINPHNPHWTIRDRFVLSKGHAAPALYAVLSLAGFFPKSEVRTLRQLGSRLQGHPSMLHTPGVDMSTGSLGQGISAACGMALVGKVNKTSWRVYTIVGDCELEEGEVWEAMMFASFHKLANLCVIIDNNNYNIDGNMDDSEFQYHPIEQKCLDFGFHVEKINGHDFGQIEQAFSNARDYKDGPTVIIQRTIKGKGVSYMENSSLWHGKVPDKQQYERALIELSERITEIQNE